MFRNFKLVPNVIFGRGCFGQLDEIVDAQRKDADSWTVFVVDDVFKGKELEKRIPAHDADTILWVNVDDEPKTTSLTDFAFMASAQFVCALTTLASES